MPGVVIENGKVVLRLNLVERVAAVSGDVTVPLADIATATVCAAPWGDSAWSGLPIGYVLGTGLPFLLNLGRSVTVDADGFPAVDMVFAKRNLNGSNYPALVLTLKPRRAYRVVVVTHADAAQLVREIQAALWAARPAGEVAGVAETEGRQNARPAEQAG